MTTEHSLLHPTEVKQAVMSIQHMLDALNARIIGQEKLIRLLVVSCLARGNVLLEGLPGLGKTELVKGLAGLLGLEFRRIQFTPDLLPSDITGSSVLEEQDGRRVMRFQPGPLFGNIILADEINRASPRTQAAMLEAMQEQRVSVLGKTHELPFPFWCMATQNPIDMEGTYPLPEAQLDRFLCKLIVTSVDTQTLQTIISERRRGKAPENVPVFEKDGLQQLFALVDRVFLPSAVANYIAKMVNATHPHSPEATDVVKKYVRYGASPRAAIGMAEAVRALALLYGKPNAGFAEAQELAPHILGHRIALDYRAKLDGISVQMVVDSIVQSLQMQHELV